MGHILHSQYCSHGLTRTTLVHTTVFPPASAVQGDSPWRGQLYLCRAYSKKRCLANTPGRSIDFVPSLPRREQGSTRDLVKHSSSEMGFQGLDVSELICPVPSCPHPTTVELDNKTRSGCPHG